MQPISPARMTILHCLARLQQGTNAASDVDAAGRVVACNLVMEYTLSSAAVARGFSSYLATLIGLRPTFFVVHAGRLNLDFLAAALVAALSGVLAIGTKHSSRFNIIITAVNLIVIVFVICAGMPYAVGDNYSPFAPFGARGIFAAASVVFFFLHRF